MSECISCGMKLPDKDKIYGKNDEVLCCGCHARWYPETIDPIVQAGRDVQRIIDENRPRMDWPMMLFMGMSFGIVVLFVMYFTAFD